MIIQIRGTSGSGKTTAMRAIMSALAPDPNQCQLPGTVACAEEWQPVTVRGRRRPLYYYLPQKKVAVLGSYETACGGCDTLKSVEAVYRLAYEIMSGTGVAHVLQEGLLLSEDTKWTKEMTTITEVRAYYLTTPMDVCLARIYERREGSARKQKPLNEEKHVTRGGTIGRSRAKLLSSGVHCQRVSADQAVDVVLKVLSAQAAR